MEIIIQYIAACLALISGTAVIIARKGTRRHKIMGYTYVGSLITVVGTALIIYNIDDGFGMFHASAFVSFITLLLGFIPILIKRPKNFGFLHYTFMFWSVVALYIAFVSEILFRIPKSPLLGVSSIFTLCIFLFGAWYYRKGQKRWRKLFGA